MAHTAPVNTTNTTLPTNTATSISQQPTQPKTHSSTSAHNQTEPPKPETTTAATVNTRSTSASSTSSSQGLPNSETQTLTSPHTSQSAATQAKTKSTISPPTSSSAPTKAHANTPSQLNVGGDSKCIISSVLNINLFWTIHWLDIDRARSELAFTTKATLFFVFQDKPVLTSTHTDTNTHHAFPVHIFYKHCHHQALHNYASVWERSSHETQDLENAQFSLFFCLSLTWSVCLMIYIRTVYLSVPILCIYGILITFSPL